MYPANYEIVRSLIVLLMMLDILCFAPHSRTFFGPAFHGKKFPRGGFISLLLFAWGMLLFLVLADVWTFPASLVLWGLYRFLYINNRWSSLFRGGGAPGFISHWAMGMICLSELCRLLDSTGALGSIFFFTYRVDLGLILLCSGSYKALAGYLKGEGMDYGLANPMWSYFFPFFKTLSPKNIFLRFQNFCAPFSQILAGLLLLHHSTMIFGALIFGGTFLYLLFLVRLGRLAATMSALSLLFLPDLSALLHGQLFFTGPPAAAVTPMLTVAWILSASYIVLLVSIKACQYLNLFANRELPSPFQYFLTTIAARIPIIIWRVFTPDVTNFFVRISVKGSADEDFHRLVDENTAYNYRQWDDLWVKTRFLLVTESISLTTVFTTLRYFPSQPQIFRERLLKYARSLQEFCEDLSAAEFEFVSIRKGSSSYEFLPIVRYRVDLVTELVEEQKVIEDSEVSKPADFSPIRESTGFGTYLRK